MKRIVLDNKNFDNAVKEAVELLQNQGIIIVPTDTCYGLAVDATSKTAVEKLLKFKGEREGKPISVAVTSKQMAEEYVELNNTAKKLYEKFMPGQLTIISKIKTGVIISEEVLCGTKTLGVRIPNDKLILEITKQFGKPITITSANISNKLQPYSYEEWQASTPKISSDLIDLFIDAKALKQKLPSTIVDTTTGQTKIVRQGEIHITLID